MAVQELPKPERQGARYTGFTEPLSVDRNTTWAHPDADTSKSACLESSTLQLVRTNSRIRSFTHRSHSSSKMMPHGRLDSSATITAVNVMASMTNDLVMEDSPTTSESMDLKRGNSSADSGVDVGKGVNEKFESDMDSILEAKRKTKFFGKLQKSRP